MPRSPVAPPPTVLSSHGLAASAYDPTDTEDVRWELGFYFRPDPGLSTDGSWWELCVDPVSSQSQFADDTAPPGLVHGEPFHLQKGLVCKGPLAVSNEFDTLARNAFLAIREPLLEGLFWSNPAGESTPYLTAPTLQVVAGGEPMPAWMAVAEIATAVGAEGVAPRLMFHCTPRVAVALDEAGIITTNGRRLVTKVGGHVVVCGAGYPGRGGNLADPGDWGDWVIATGPVVVRWGSTIDVTPQGTGLNRASNENHVVVSQTAAVYFDTNVHYAARVRFDPGGVDDVIVS